MPKLKLEAYKKAPFLVWHKDLMDSKASNHPVVPQTTGIWQLIASVMLETAAVGVLKSMATSAIFKL